LALWRVEEAEFMNTANSRGDNRALWGTPNVRLKKGRGVAIDRDKQGPIDNELMKPR